MPFKNYIKHEWKHFISSLNCFGRKYLLSALLDIVFYTIIFAIIYFYAGYMQQTLIAFQEKGVFELFNKNIDALAPGEIDRAVSDTSSLYTSVIALTLTVIILILILFSLFKGLIYAILLDKRFTARFYLKFLSAALIWLIFWLLIFTFIANFIRLELRIYFNIASLMLMLYTAGILFTAYAIYEKIGACFRHAFNLLKRTHLFIFPYLLIILALIVLNLLSIMLRLMPDLAAAIISFIITVFFLSWSRIYVISIVKRALGR